MKQQESRFWLASSALFAVVALAKGFRTPSSWAMSQLQITYIRGFVKRGLLGQLLFLAHVRSAHAVDAFCFAELAVLVGLFALFTRRSGIGSARGLPVTVAAFAGSYAVTFLAHLVGYQDIALYALAIAVVLVRHVTARFLLALPVTALALLMHENFLLSALPVILFSFLIEREAPGTRRNAWYGAGLLLLAALITVGIALRPNLSPADLQAFKQATLARVQYPINPGLLDLVAMSTAANLKLNFSVIRHFWWWWAELAVAFAVLGPLIALLVADACALVRGRERLAFLGCSFAPLLLNVIGWDNVRWMALCALTTYINLGLLIRAVPTHEPRPASVLRERYAILVLCLGMASGHGLMDGEKIKPYPFFPSVIRPLVLRHDGVVGGIL